MECISFREQLEFYQYSGDTRPPRCDKKFTLFLKIMSYYPYIGNKIRNGIIFLKKSSLADSKKLLEELLPIVETKTYIKYEFQDDFSEWDDLLKDYLKSHIKKTSSKKNLIELLKDVEISLDLCFLRFMYFITFAPEKLEYKKSLILRLQDLFVIPRNTKIIVLYDTVKKSSYDVQELLNECTKEGVLDQAGLEKRLKNCKSYTCTNYEINDDIESLLNVLFSELKSDVDKKVLRIVQCPNCGIFFIPHSKQVFCERCQKLSDDIKAQNPFQKIFRPISKRANQHKKPEDKQKKAKFLSDARNKRDEYQENFKNKIPTEEDLERYKQELEKLYADTFKKGGADNGKRNNKK